jgi:hypothetical protein
VCKRSPRLLTTQGLGNGSEVSRQITSLSKISPPDLPPSSTNDYLDILNGQTTSAPFTTSPSSPLCAFRYLVIQQQNCSCPSPHLLSLFLRPSQPPLAPTTPRRTRPVQEDFDHLVYGNGISGRIIRNQWTPEASRFARDLRVRSLIDRPKRDSKIQ